LVALPARSVPVSAKQSVSAVMSAVSSAARRVELEAPP
jgi:hypothetical protein